MAQLPYTYDKLLICNPDVSRSTCQVFVAHQSPTEEKSLGKVFFVAEIASRDRINLDIIKKIQEQLLSSYYRTDDLNIETAFEKALESTNQIIADMVGDYDVNWLDKLNAIAFVLKDDAIYFSTVGHTHAFLVRQNKIIDILRTTENGAAAHEKINPLKAFSNIISGPLQTEDTLVLTTPNLLDYLSQEKLRRIVQEHSAGQSVRMIDNLLSENTTNTAFSAVIIKMEPVNQEQRSPANISVATQPARTQPTIPAARDTESSMSDLLQKKEQTGDVLAPSLSKHLGALIKKTFERCGTFIRLKLLRQSARRVRFQQQMRAAADREQPAVATRTKPLLKNMKATMKKAAATSGKGARLLSQAAKKTGKVSRQTSPRSLSAKADQYINSLKRLPKISKLLLLLVLIVAFVLAQGIFSSAQSKQSAQELIVHTQTISDISEKILKAEAALSYGNEDGAKELLTEAQELLASFPDDDESTAEKRAELSQDIDAQFARTRHIVVSAPRDIADLSEFETDITARSLVYLPNNTLVTVNPSTNTIYTTDSDSGETTSSDQSDHPRALQYVTAKGTSSTVLMDTGLKLSEFNTTDDNFSSLTFNLEQSDPNIASIALYDTRLYLLDIKNNQIYRSFGAGSGYGTPVEWKTDDTDLTSAVSMAIDGNIYVLRSDGGVIKLFQGQRLDWSIAPIDPALTNGDAIWTNSETDKLYILDAKGRRVLEFSKESGSLVNQYTADVFSVMHDIAASPEDGELYVLNNTVLYGVELLPQS